MVAVDLVGIMQRVHIEDLQNFQYLKTVWLLKIQCPCIVYITAVYVTVQYIRR